LHLISIVEKNFIQFKKDLATHTRLSPSQRVEQLKNLIDSIRSTPEALKYLTNWGLNIETDLRYIQGRTLPLEKIIFESKEIEPDHRLDWTKAAGFERCVRSTSYLFIYVNYRQKNMQFVCMKFNQN
jgi:hypothetical protein